MKVSPETLTWSPQPGRRRYHLDQDPEYVVEWLSLGHYAARWRGVRLNERTDCTFEAAKGFAERRYRIASYVPRKGDRVRVVRYVNLMDGGGREDRDDRTGEVTNVQPQADGHRVWLDGDPDWIFTGPQWTGHGHLMTEVTPVLYRVQLSPDLAVRLDGSQCITVDVTDPGTGKLLHTATVTDVDALKAALDGARDAQRRELGRADERRASGIEEAQEGRGRLSRGAAVERLITFYVPRGLAANAVARSVSAGPQTVQGRDPESGTRPVGLAVTFLGGTRFSVIPA
jgi:hypothetical protein